VQWAATAVNSETAPRKMMVRNGSTEFVSEKGNAVKQALWGRHSLRCNVENKGSQQLTS
jgi:hypothetical protein